MKIKHIHTWPTDAKTAIPIQSKLAEDVLETPVRKSIHTIAGMDCAFSTDKQRIGAAVVVLEAVSFEIVEIQTATMAVTMPYIPGLLSFREAPVCLKAVEKLDITPDIFIIDGQGLAHPRRLGLASHLGILMDVPTIGCAKSRLIGTYETPGLEKGDCSPLYKGNRKIGAVLRTRSQVKPLFISVGHKCTLNDAVKTVLKAAIKYRLPEPTRLAHQEVSRLKPLI